MTDQGYSEAITYSFVNPRWQELLNPEPLPLRLANPLSGDMSVMRTSYGQVCYRLCNTIKTGRFPG